MTNQEKYNTVCELCGEKMSTHLKCKMCGCPGHSKENKCSVCGEDHTKLNKEGLCGFCSELKLVRKDKCVRCGTVIDKNKFLVRGNYCGRCNYMFKLMGWWRCLADKVNKGDKNWETLERLRGMIWEKFNVDMYSEQENYKQIKVFFQNVGKII
jgi:hypothetical protein